MVIASLVVVVGGKVEDFAIYNQEVLKVCVRQNILTCPKESALTVCAMRRRTRARMYVRTHARAQTD